LSGVVNPPTEDQYYKQYIGLKIFLPENLGNMTQSFFSVTPSFVKTDKPIDYFGTLCDSVLTFQFKPTFSYGFNNNNLKAYDETHVDFYTKQTDLENRYYTIVDILHQDSLVDLRNRMNTVIDNNQTIKQKKTYLHRVPDKFYHSSVFVLKEEETGEKLYYVGYPTEFILVPYFVKQKQMFEGKTFVPISYGYNKVERNESFILKDLITNEKVNLYKSGKWRCEVTLMDRSKVNDEFGGKQYRITYLFKNEKNTIALVDGHDDVKITPYSNIRAVPPERENNYSYSFILEDVYTKQEHDKKIKKEELLAKQKIAKQVVLNKSKIEKENFRSSCINKFGQENGEIIAQQRVKIGMTIEMCEVAWGKPYDKSRSITSDQSIESWYYGWKRSLYFVNGILSRIND
jgi:hypothetical protein